MRFETGREQHSAGSPGRQQGSCCRGHVSKHPLLGCKPPFPLQDRGRWDEDNAKLFPETVKFFKQLNGGVGSWAGRPLGRAAPALLKLPLGRASSRPVPWRARLLVPTSSPSKARLPPRPRPANGRGEIPAPAALHPPSSVLPLQPPPWRSSLPGSPPAPASRATPTLSTSSRPPTWGCKCPRATAGSR